MDPRAPHIDPPELVREIRGGVGLVTDVSLRERHGIVVAFSERIGGVSDPPYDSLNLATHVGDDPRAVDENRSRLLRALRIEGMQSKLTTAEQVHGDHVEAVDIAAAGSGASALGNGNPVPATDALVTTCLGVPLLMCYADCVPVTLVVRSAKRGIAVVHAGWRGALAGLPGIAAKALCVRSECDSSSLVAYIGPHVRSCCYEVDDARISQFSSRFVTIAAVDNELDLSAAVRENLECAGVPGESIVDAGLCTFDHPERFYSFRAAQVTGRHGAIAAIV